MHDVISIIHLKKYRGAAPDVRPPLMNIDDKEHFEVEKIDSERVNAQGQTEYLVK
jgi:hypothetical protein